MAETKVKYIITFGIAPYFNTLILKDIEGTPYAFKVKKQYDGYITYFSKNLGKVLTIYVGSLFLGHCNAKVLLNHFFQFVKQLKLNTDLLLAIGMDGPNINKSFQKKLCEKLEKEKGNRFIPLRSFVLHIVNNGFGEGMKKIKAIIDIEQLLIDLYFFSSKIPPLLEE